LERTHGYGGIDRFRLIAATLIVGIHTYPLVSISDVVNFYVIHVLARVAVPFFLMVTGYFLLPRYLFRRERDIKPLVNFIKKTGLIYALATLLYLPISIYAGHYAGVNLFTAIARNIVFDGTFYHLWYLPASIIGVLILYVLGRKFSFHVILVIVGALYIIGLFGDNYFGVISGVPFLREIYYFGFNIFSFTRNGLFYAPIFLVMGAIFARSGNRIKSGESIIGLVISLSMLVLEGHLLRNSGLSRHSSMYFALLPSMFFLFNILLTIEGKSVALLRGVSMWIFILHPLFIIVVRGMARVLRLTHLLVENSVINFITVYIISVVASVFCAVMLSRYKGRSFV